MNLFSFKNLFLQKRTKKMIVNLNTHSQVKVYVSDLRYFKTSSAKFSSNAFLDDFTFSNAFIFTYGGVMSVFSRNILFEDFILKPICVLKPLVGNWDIKKAELSEAWKR